MAHLIEAKRGGGAGGLTGNERRRARRPSLRARIGAPLESERHHLRPRKDVSQLGAFLCVGITPLVGAHAIGASGRKRRLHERGVIIAHKELEVLEGLGPDALRNRRRNATLLDAHVHDCAHVAGKRELRIGLNGE